MSITLLNNNKLNIKLMHNTEQHNHTKHIDIQHHYICNMIDNKKLIIECIFMNNMLTDKLMKTLTKNIFKSCHQQLKVVQLDEMNRQRK